MKKVVAFMLALQMLLCLCGCEKANQAGVQATVETENGENIGASAGATVPVPDDGQVSEDSNTVGAGAELSIPKELLELDLTALADFDLAQFLLDAAKNFTAEDLEALKGMGLNDLVEIVRVRMSLLSDMATALAQAGIEAAVDQATGQVTLDATVLFERDSAELSASGKELLKKFAQAYSYVVLHEKYNGLISAVMVEGHTDTDGSYEYNQELSQARADSVKEFMLSEECGLSEEACTALEGMLESKGCACDEPVLDANGEVDMAKSRRVTFRFVIDLTKLITD